MKNTIRIKVAVLVVLVALVVVIMTTFAVYAKTVSEQYYAVEMKTVIVSRGESVWDIARRNLGDYPGTLNDYIMLICEQNEIEITGTKIIVLSGQSLTFPIYTKCHE